MSESMLVISVFTGIVTALSATVLLIRHLLVASKPVRLRINDQREVQANSGDTLLTTLAGVDVNLPSACGGQGTCGQCRVVITGGCPPSLPLERNLINQRDERAGTRLACMHKVYNDMTLSVPASALAAGTLTLVVSETRLLSPTLLELSCTPEGGVPETLAAGDYLVLEAPATHIDFATINVGEAWEHVWQNSGYRALNVDINEPTRRAYSLANAPGQNNYLQFVVRLALPPDGQKTRIPPGEVTSWLFSLQPGDRLRTTGPYGNFHVTERVVREEGEIICIGGGAGIAPLRSIVQDLLLSKRSTQRLSFWYGSRNRQELVYADEFIALERAHPNFSFHPALSDPAPHDQWQGATGFIHHVVEADYLANHPSPQSVHYYLCGPPPMTDGALAMLDKLGVPSTAIIFDNFGSQTTHASDLPGIT